MGCYSVSKNPQALIIFLLSQDSCHSCKHHVNFQDKEGKSSFLLARVCLFISKRKSPKDFPLYTIGHDTVTCLPDVHDCQGEKAWQWSAHDPARSPGVETSLPGISSDTKRGSFSRRGGKERNQCWVSKEFYVIPQYWKICSCLVLQVLHLLLSIV